MSPRPGGVGTSADKAFCRHEILRWDTRYDTRGRHCYCSYLSPNAYETRLAVAKPEAA